MPLLLSPLVYVADENSRRPAGLPWKENGSEQKNDHQIKVMVVDDDRLIANTIAEILRNSGFLAVAVYDAWQALDEAPRFRPDCVLSDVVMPGMSGVELARTFQMTRPDTRVILFSGQVGHSEILNEAHAKGQSFEILAKPIHPRKLIELLRKPK